MPISPKLRSYLDRRGAQFDEVPHAKAQSAAEAAQAARVDRAHTGKAVLVRTGDGYMLAVVPASRHVELDELKSWLGRSVQLAEEGETERLFSDCDLGAIPPIGAAFDVETVVDEALFDGQDVYFEAGDHRTLLHMSAADWRKAMNGAAHGAFSA